MYRTVGGGRVPEDESELKVSTSTVICEARNMEEQNTTSAFQGTFGFISSAEFLDLCPHTVELQP